jgi:predicted nucleic acid-binding protein
LKQPSERILNEIGEGSLDATTNTVVIQEILFILDRRGNREAGIAIAQDIMDLIPDLLPVTRPDMIMASLLLEQYQQLKSRDAVHAATMRTNGFDTIITADRHFDSIEGVNRIDPSEY